MRRSDRPTRRNRCPAAVPRWSAAPWRAVLSLTFLLLAGSAWSFAGVFEENWDSLGQGGDGINSFTMGPLFPDNSLVAVNGSRCQYDDPQGPTGRQFEADCRPWNGSDWHVHLPSNSPEAKSFSGDGSLHMGRHPDPVDASFDDYHFNQLSAAMSPPLTLEVNPDPEEGPKLSFWHIIASADSRTFNPPGISAFDRGVVQVALSDEQGNILSDWQNIHAFRNPARDTHLALWFVNCSFDPIDDGSTEDDITTPPGEIPPLGPSSTCVPERVFHNMGDWTSTNRKDVGRAESKVGQPGNMGTGVWVQSRFDLQAWEGQTIRIRVLFTGLDVLLGSGWSDLFGNSLGNGMRGWVLDDFRVTGTADP